MSRSSEFALCTAVESRSSRSRPGASSSSEASTPTATDEATSPAAWPPDAVGDDEQPRTGVPGVLVDLPEETHVGAGGVPQGERHGGGRYFRSSTTVLPMRIGMPILTGVALVTLVRSR